MSEELIIDEAELGDPLARSDELEIAELGTPFIAPSRDYTNRVASMAAVASIDTFNPNTLEGLYNSKFNEFKATIESGGEEGLRAVFDQQFLLEQTRAFEDVALRALEGSIENPSEDVQNAIDALSALDEKTFKGLEELAVQKIKDLALSDENQLAIAEERLGNIEVMNIEDAVQRHVVRGLDMLRELESATAEVKDQSFIEDVADVLLTIIPTNLGTSADNLVELIGSYASLRGTNLRNQARYLMFNANEEDYKKAMPKFVAALKEQSGFLSENSHIVKHNLEVIMSGMSERTIEQANALNILDWMFALPFTKVVRMSSSAILKMLGNRELAKDTTARLLLDDMAKASGKQGDDLAAKTTDDAATATEESLPAILKPNPAEAPEQPTIGAAVHDALEQVRLATKTIKDQLGGLGRLEGDELEEMVTKEVARIREVNGRRVVPIDVFAGGFEAEQGIGHVILGLGKKNGGLFKNENEAVKAIKRMGLEKAEVDEAAEGGWFIKVKHNVNESQFYKTWTEKDVGVKAPFLHFLRSPDSFNPEVVTQMAAQASFKKSVLFKSYKDIQKKLKGLNKQQKKRMDELTIYGTDNDKWWSPAEYVKHYSSNYKNKDGSKALPSDREIIAYQAQTQLHDLNHGVLNWAEKVKLTSQGWAGGSIKGLKSVTGDPLKIFKEIEGEVHDLRNLIIYNTDTEGLIFGRDITTSGLKELMDKDGLKLFKSYNEVLTPDGTPAGYVLAKPGNHQAFQMGDVIPYRAGGPRAYDAHFFAGQFNSTISNGKTIIRNPLTMFAGRTRAELKEAVENMEKARLHHNADTLTDDLVEELTPYASKEEWQKAINSNTINSDQPFRIWKDGEAPLPGKGKDGSSLDEAGSYDIRTVHTGVDFSRGASGRLLMSRRGERLLGGDYAKAKVIAPMELIQKVSSNLLHTAAFTDFQVSATTRWAKTYQSILKEGRLSPEQMFFRGELRTEGVPPQLLNKAIASRAAIKRILGEGSEHSALWRHGVTRLSEWVEHGTIPSVIDPIAAKVGVEHARARASAFILDGQSKDPINAIKGLAFDLKLGLMDPSQLIIQTQTIAAMATIRPTKVKTYIWDGAWMRYSHVNQSEEFLNFAAKRADMDEAEFKLMVTEMRKGGYADVNGELILTDHHSTSLYGPKGSAIAQARNLARWPFYEAERLNRVYAYRMAWDDLKEAFPKGKTLDKAFENGDASRFLAKKTNDYTMNMITSSAAAYQKGILAVPAQFMSYQARMFENIFASKAFTPAQRVRLGLGQLVLYGSAGIPFGTYLADSIIGATGVEFDESLGEQTMQRAVMGGVFDSMIYLATTGEVDVAFSKRAAVGQGIQQYVEDLFGMGMHTKSFMEIIGGASFSILGDVASDAYQAIRYISLAASAEQVGMAEMTPLVLSALTENISSASRLMKAYYVYKYGVFASQETGKALTFATPAESIAAALGIPLREIADLSIMTYALNNRSDFIKENGKPILRLRNEAMRSLVIDDNIPEFEQKLDVASALLQVYDVEDRYDILEWVNRQQQSQTISQRYRDKVMKVFPSRQLPELNQ